jgi:hypothetical protein
LAELGINVFLDDEVITFASCRERQKQFPEKNCDETSTLLSVSAHSQFIFFLERAEEHA